MLKIKQTELPPVAAHWSYGPDYMRGISRKSAAGLCGMYPMPAMGCETIVAIAPDGYGGRFRLTVQNISGAFYLACSNVKVEDWPDVFKVQIIEKAGA